MFWITISNNLSGAMSSVIMKRSSAKGNNLFVLKILQPTVSEFISICANQIPTALSLSISSLLVPFLGSLFLSHSFFKSTTLSSCSCFPPTRKFSSSMFITKLPWVTFGRFRKLFSLIFL